MASLTRHLYRFEEVRAAFLYCLKSKRTVEAFFWLTELEESCYGGEARRLLFIAWFLFIGVRRLAWLLDWSQTSTTREGRRTLTLQLCQCSERDSSLWLLLWAAALQESLSQSSSLLTCQWRKVFQSDQEDFWTEMLAQSEDERIDRCLEALQEDMRAYSLYAKSTASCISTMAAHSLKKTWEPLNPRWPEEVLTALEDWSHMQNLRERRVYAIPYECLFGMTARGRGGDTSMDLQGLSEVHFQQSPWWKKVLPPEGLEDDSANEAFWDTYFPWTTCDHPDEWSKRDREKSHGEGVRVDGATSSPLWRWWRTWVVPGHLYIWGTEFQRIQDFIQTGKADTCASVLDMVLDLYKQKTLTPWAGTRLPKVFVLEE